MMKMQVETFPRANRKWVVQISLKDENGREIWRKALDGESESEGGAVARAESAWRIQFRGLVVALGHDDPEVVRLLASRKK